MTSATLRLLEAMLAEPTSRHWGYRLQREAQLKGGSLYPILIRLEEEGWIEGRWESPEEKSDGRPARRYYMLTGTGIAAARAAVCESEERAWRAVPRLADGLA